MADLEPESLAAVRARRRQRLVRSLSELALAGGFVAALLAAKHFGMAHGPASTLAVLSSLAAVAALAAWFAAHIFWHRRLDEFERAIELRALAFAGGATVLFAAAWGIFEVMLAAPDFPIAMLAPLFSIFYALTRLMVVSGYR